MCLYLTPRAVAGTDSFSLSDGAGLNCPQKIDPTGTSFRDLSELSDVRR